MILVDTSVWIDHLRRGSPDLVELLDRSEVLGHPFVTGELAVGRLVDRSEVLDLLERLPRARVATDAEVLTFIDAHELAGSGIGYVDAHLLAATVLTDDAHLWTRDRKLAVATDNLGLGRQEG